MIIICNLTEDDVGKEVIRTGGAGEKEYGKIKSWNDRWIFVVYHCAGEWDNFQDYTAAATEPEELQDSIND